jgi:hypothetical protein
MTCEHTINVQIKMPSLTGGANPDGCPFVWCRSCGAIWLPRLRVFTQAFERHEKVVGYAPIDGLDAEGYWILPGVGGIITLPKH